MSITLLLIIITAAISIMAFERRDITEKLIFNAYVINRRKEWYRFISHGFIHADWMHLAVNMYVLWGFGKLVENTFITLFDPFGRVVYIVMYLLAIGVASLSSYKKYHNHPGYNSLGASGATSAIIFASILIYPTYKIGLIIFPIGVPGIVMGVLYLIYSSYMSKRGGDNINHDAHFYGAVFGFLFPLLLKPSLGMLFIDQIKTYIGGF